MLPFPVTLVPGESPYRQVVYAATKAVVAGVLPPGSPFPSVREISQALRINPNTAHKVVTELVRAGLLEVLPGVGTVVARAAVSPSPSERAALLSTQVEQLVVEALRLGLDAATVHDAVSARWRELAGAPAAAPVRDAMSDRTADRAADQSAGQSPAQSPMSIEPTLS